MDQNQIAVRILKENGFLFLGSASATAEPWITPVAYKCDDQLNLYWTSDVHTKHSDFITQNSQASACVFDQRDIAAVQYPDGKSHPRAIYLAGTAREIPYDELRELLHWRYGHGQHVVTDFDPSQQTRRIYQLTTEAVWYLDDPRMNNGLPADQRIPLDLTALRNLMLRAL